MEDSKEIFTIGFWSTKSGKESEFIAAWDKFARWTMLNQPRYCRKCHSDTRRF